MCIDNQLLEQILIFFLRLFFFFLFLNIKKNFFYLFFRIFNLYYTVFAEEKTRCSQESSNFSLFWNKETNSSPAAEKLTNLAKQMTGKVENNLNVRNSLRISNLSYLIGTGIRQQRPTSYLQSFTMKNLEPVIMGSYKTFLVIFYLFI